MELDPLILSRIQFAFVVSFHILFPAFTIGLASWIVALEWRWWRTGDDIFYRLSMFWTKIFAVSFGLGVVSGIVMTWQFGTNWSTLSYAGAHVLGPLIQYEVVTAFFLEAAFLGILLFGRDLVPRGVHFAAAVAVAVGTLISAFWILSANSWMQTPAGFELRDDGRFYAADWSEIVFNPSFPYRLFHMVGASYLTTAFVVAGFSAWYLLKGRHLRHARIGFSMAMWAILVLAPLQILLGDLHGLNTLEHQPLKVAAMEGNWSHRAGAPFVLFGLPDEETQSNWGEINVPFASSIILTHSLEGEVPVLVDFPVDEWPWIFAVFWTFRVMVALGFLMLLVGVLGAFMRRRGRLYDARWFLRLAVLCTPIGFVAVLAGWFTTELGRQPYVVYGLVRTEDAVSPSLTGGQALTSLIAFVVVYAFIYFFGSYYLARMLRIGPEEPPEAKAPEAEREARRPKRPLSAPETSIEAGE